MSLLHAKTLRSRWNHRVSVLAAIIFVCGLANFLGTRLLVETFRGSAVGLEREATLSAVLKADIVSEAVLIATPVTDAQQEQANAIETKVRADFDELAAAENTTTAKLVLAKARNDWEALLVAAGPDVELATRGTAVSEGVPPLLAVLDGASAASRAGTRDDLSDAARLERIAVPILGVLQVIAIALVLRLARRLSTEVLRPVGILRDSANHLATGQLDHRVVLYQRDELGELAVSFNVMADAISGTQRSLEQEASTDSLSGLLNRAAFGARLQTTLQRLNRREVGQAVLFVDLDDFKDVNDTLGHAAGDELLREVGRRLSMTVRPGDVVARLGGDEFALLLDGLTSSSVAIEVAQRVVSVLSEVVEIGSSHVRVAASVGVAIRDEDSTPDELMREADVAMYAAKGRGKNRVECYDAGLDVATSSRHSLRSEVASAVAGGQLVLEYQPIVELNSGRTVGMEALVRWHHPTRGLLQPSAFIELAEETDAIIAIGSWVLGTAARQMREWQHRFHLSDVWISVNVSMRQLNEADFAEQVRRVLRVTGLDPANLVLEVTESQLADPNGQAAATLFAIRALGVRIALDDFGSGYSSINYLRQLPVDIIKIDHSFTTNSEPCTAGGALIEGIVALAQHLGLEIIPEGIEDSSHLARLYALGCRVGQGFLLSRPLSVDAVEELIARSLARADLVPLRPGQWIRPSPRRTGRDQLVDASHRQTG